MGLALGAVILLAQSVVANDSPPCSNPSVRREWRSLPPEERAEWMAAVKVAHPHASPMHITDTSGIVSQLYASQLFFDSKL